MAFIKYGRSSISSQLTTIAESLSSSSGGAKEKRVDLITSTQSWTAPAGVTYAIAHITAGGGGGGGNVYRGSYGANSSAFGVIAEGAVGGSEDQAGNVNNASYPGKPNTGNGGVGIGGYQSNGNNGADGSTFMAGSVVIPGSSYTITIGGGGSNGGGAGNGGSGRVAIEYYVSA